jgi:hypothetical protein
VLVRLRVPWNPKDDGRVKIGVCQRVVRRCEVKIGVKYKVLGGKIALGRQDSVN